MILYYNRVLQCCPELFINSSEDYLNIIWSNLISNAIKFTKDHIIIKLHKKNEYLIFEIKDNGIDVGWGRKRSVSPPCTGEKN